MHRIATYTAALILIAWIAAGFYFGAAAIVVADTEAFGAEIVHVPPGDPSAEKFIVDGVTFADANSAEQFIREREIGAAFPWLVELPSFLVALIGAASLGAVGAAVRALRQCNKRGAVDFTCWQALALPIEGIYVGVAILGIGYFVPAVLFRTSGQESIRGVALLAVCLIGGFSSDRVIRWFHTRLSAWTAPSGEPGV